MIVFLDGRVAAIGSGYVDLDVHQVGYRVYVTDDSSQALQAGEEIRLYTYQHVREDAVLLYGFMRAEDRAVFERLLSVSGIGPRLALAMIGAMPAEALVAAIQSEDANALCALPGVGKKTAQRMILDLKDKLGDLPLTWSGVFRQPHQAETSPDVAEDVTTALVALGYRPREASAAVTAVLEQNQRRTVEGAVKAALQWLYEHQSE